MITVTTGWNNKNRKAYDMNVKEKQIRSLEGKIQRLRRKFVETKDEKVYYKAKDMLAEQQMRLDLLLGRSLNDY